MNQRIIIASAIILGAAVAFAETPQLEQQLKELSRAPVDYTVAGKWFKIAKDIANDGQRQEALKAAAAALIYSQKGDVYQKSVKTQINDASAFEDEFLKECPDCQGGGESERPCPVCKGTGKCQYANCQGGMHRIHQINGDRYEPCRECKGSGQCQKCKGEGNVKGKCVRCGGRGKSVDRDKVLAAYRDHADKVIQWVQVERERKDRERKEAEEKVRIKKELTDEMRSHGLENIEEKAVAIPLADMEKSFVSWFVDHHSGIGSHPPRLTEQTLEFKSRLVVSAYDIPLELQSGRMLISFRSTGDTDKASVGFTTIDLATVDSSDMVFIIIDGDEVFVNSRRNSSNDKIKIADDVGKWKSVFVEMKQDETVVSVSGKRISFHPLNGVRFARIGISVGKANLLLKNLYSFPSATHREAAQMYDEGLTEAFSGNGDMKANVAKVISAAEMGLAEAQTGYVALRNLGLVKLTESEVFKWCFLAAKQGLRAAQTKIGVMYYLGDGVEKNEQEAFRWFSKAAVSRDHYAEMQCANILMYGKEIPHDFKEARRLLTLALAGEENFTSKEKGQLYAFMADSYLLSDGVTQLRQPWKKDDIETAVGWLRKAIQCGNSSAQYVLNKLIDEGLY